MVCHAKCVLWKGIVNIETRLNATQSVALMKALFVVKSKTHDPARERCCFTNSDRMKKREERGLPFPHITSDVYSTVGTRTVFPCVPWGRLSMEN